MAKADAKGEFKTGTTAEADGFIRSSGYMNWFSAQNFCRSYGKNLVTLSQMGLGNVLPPGMEYCSGYTSCQNIDATGWSAIQAKFGDDFSPWTANLDQVSGYSCDAFYVILSDSFASVLTTSRYTNFYYALCK